MRFVPQWGQVLSRLPTALPQTIQTYLFCFAGRFGRGLCSRLSSAWTGPDSRLPLSFFRDGVSVIVGLQPFPVSWHVVPSGRVSGKSQRASYSTPRQSKLLASQTATSGQVCTTGACASWPLSSVCHTSHTRARTPATRSLTAGAISSMNIRSRGAVGTPQRTKVEKPWSTARWVRTLTQ